MPSRRFGSLVLACGAICLLFAGWALADSRLEEQGRRLVFLLQYVGTDYANAVREGQVVSEVEYREMVDFSASAQEMLEKSIRAELPPSSATVVDAALRRLIELISAKAEPRAVSEQAATAIAELIDSLDLKPVPRAIPRPERAATLYRDACELCHGEKGDGEGVDAADYDPRPADFTDRERMEAKAPFVFYNALTFGIDGTAMPSFRDSLDDQERWDLAFFLYGFTRPNPLPDAEPIVLTLRDLAIRSTGELLPEVLRQAREEGIRLDDAGARALIADRRARPRPVADHGARLARVRDDLERSLDRLAQGDFDAATHIVTTAYLDDFEPVEPELDRRDRRIRDRFERGLTEFRRALRAGDGGAAKRLGAELLETTAAAQRLFTPDDDAARGRRTLIVLGLVGVIAGAGLVSMLIRTGRPGVGKPDPEV